MEALIKHIRDGILRLRKHAGLIAIAIFTLSVGIGADAATAPAPLIPRHLFYVDEDKIAVRLSPDGRTISYLAPVDGTEGVWSCDVANPGQPRLLFKETDGSVM